MAVTLPALAVYDALLGAGCACRSYCMICGCLQTLRWHVVQPLSQIGDAEHKQKFYAQLKKWRDAANFEIIQEEGPEGSEIQSLIYDGNGAGGVYAFTYFPNAGAVAGDVHFDAYDAWSSTGDGQIRNDRVDFDSVALHEIGHGLGLGHEPRVRKAVMYPYFALGEERRKLDQDDINGIIKLYGPRQVDDGCSNCLAHRETGPCKFANKFRKRLAITLNFSVKGQQRLRF